MSTPNLTSCGVSCRDKFLQAIGDCSGITNTTRPDSPDSSTCNCPAGPLSDLGCCMAPCSADDQSFMSRVVGAGCATPAYLTFKCSSTPTYLSIPPGMATATAGCTGGSGGGNSTNSGGLGGGVGNNGSGGVSALGLGLSVGLGVGIPVAALVVGAAFFWRRRRARRRAGGDGEDGGTHVVELRDARDRKGMTEDVTSSNDGDGVVRASQITEASTDCPESPGGNRHPQESS